MRRTRLLSSRACVDAVTDSGATIGSHNGGLPNPTGSPTEPTAYDYWHWGPDQALDTSPPGFPSGYAYAQESLETSFEDIETWMGANPYPGATRTSSSRQWTRRLRRGRKLPANVRQPVLQRGSGRVASDPQRPGRRVGRRAEGRSLPDPRLLVQRTRHRLRHDRHGRRQLVRQRRHAAVDGQLRRRRHASGCRLVLRPRVARQPVCAQPDDGVRVVSREQAQSLEDERDGRSGVVPRAGTGLGDPDVHPLWCFVDGNCHDRRCH